VAVLVWLFPWCFCNTLTIDKMNRHRGEGRKGRRTQTNIKPYGGIFDGKVCHVTVIIENYFGKYKPVPTPIASKVYGAVEILVMGIEYINC